MTERLAHFCVQLMTELAVLCDECHQLNGHHSLNDKKSPQLADNKPVWPTVASLPSNWAGGITVRQMANPYERRCQRALGWQTPFNRVQPV